MKELDLLTHELYRCVCFQEGERPDRGKLKTLFFNNGKLINNSGPEPREFTVDEFCLHVLQQINKASISAFHEKEIAHKTDVFGNVAQRFSTYEARFDETSSDPVAIGVNCIQFMRADGKWQIVSMVWDDETP